MFHVQVAWSRLEGTDARIHIYRYNDGANSPGGTFVLSFKGDATSPIPYQADAAYVEAALESLLQIGDVTVTRDEFSPTATSWLVEFTTLGTPANIGDLPMLEADGSFLTGKSVRITVEEMSDGCCTVEISANGGADFTVASDDEAHQAAAFRYQDRAVVRSVEPNAGPASGGTPVILRGTGFILLFDAASGTSNDLVCLFGGRLESPAVRMNSTMVVCTSPPTPFREAATMSVAVRWSGSVGQSITTAVFTYFEDVALGALIPRWGSNAGGFSTAISLAQGSFLTMGVDVTCAIEVRSPSTTNDRYAAREYAHAARRSGVSNLDFTANVKAESILNKEVYLCDIPGLHEFFPGVADTGWLGHDWRAIALVSLSGNKGINLTAPQTFIYVPRPTVVEAWPSLGSEDGGTMVTVRGTNFVPPGGAFDEGELLCRFGHTAPVSARFISHNTVTCQAPPHMNQVAVMSVVVGGGSVFYSTQEVLLRVPSPMSSRKNASYSSERASVVGTWTISLEKIETYGMYSNVTAQELSLALSALPNVGNVTAIAETSVFNDHYAGLSWNETTFIVHFIARDGYVPAISVNTSNLHLKETEREEEKAKRGMETDVDGYAVPRLVPTGSVRVVSEGHDGDGAVREEQILRTKRSALSGEVQTVTIKTTQSSTAEVSQSNSICAAGLLHQWLVGRSSLAMISCLENPIPFDMVVGNVPNPGSSGDPNGRRSPLGGICLGSSLAGLHEIPSTRRFVSVSCISHSRTGIRARRSSYRLPH